MVIFNTFILIHLVSRLPLRFSLYSLKTWNSIYYVPNTHFFSMLCPICPKRSITMQDKIDPLGQYGSRCRLSYQLSSRASKCNLQPIITFFHTFLGKTLSQFTLSHPPVSCFSDKHSHQALVLLLSPFHASLWPPHQALYSPKLPLIWGHAEQPSLKVCGRKERCIAAYSLTGILR